MVSTIITEALQLSSHTSFARGSIAPTLPVDPAIVVVTLDQIKLMEMYEETPELLRITSALTTAVKTQVPHKISRSHGNAILWVIIDWIIDFE